MTLPLPQKSAHRKRLNEWEKWLDIFYTTVLKKDRIKGFKYIPNAAWLLNDLYWKITEQYIRPILKAHNDKNYQDRIIHPYKIVSASEITVMMVKPIQITNDVDKEKKYNALLAWFVAIQIIEGWETGNPIKINAIHINKIADYKEYITSRKYYPETLSIEHIKWLINVNLAIEKPIFLNAQFWRLFYLCCLTLAQSNK